MRDGAGGQNRVLDKRAGDGKSNPFASGRGEAICPSESLDANRETREWEFGGVTDQWPKWVVSLDRVDMGRNGVRHRSIPGVLLDSDAICAVLAEGVAHGPACQRGWGP